MVMSKVISSWLSFRGTCSGSVSEFHWRKSHDSGVPVRSSFQTETQYQALKRTAHPREDRAGPLGKLHRRGYRNIIGGESTSWRARGSREAGGCSLTILGAGHLRWAISA